MSQAQPKSPLAMPEPWDLVSSGYSDEVVPQFEPFAVRALELARVGPSTRVVDVAAGPGTLAFLARARGANVSALDFAPAMIAALHARAEREGIRDIDARLGDGMALPYADQSFDAAFSMFGLMFFPDRPRGFAELLRVLVPGGRAVISSWQPMEKVPLLNEMFAALRALVPGLPPGPTKATLGELSEVRDELSAAGFREVQAEPHQHVVEAPSLRAWWEGAQRTTAPLVLMRNKMGETAFAPVANGVYERLAARFGEGPQRFELNANLGVGVR